MAFTFGLGPFKGQCQSCVLGWEVGVREVVDGVEGWGRGREVERSVVTGFQLVTVTIKCEVAYGLSICIFRFTLGLF